MEYQEMFKFLNLQIMQRKNADKLPEDERNFLVVNFLDLNCNPCRFFVFNKDLMKKMLSTKYSGLQDLVVTFTVTYSNDNWHVNLVDVHE